jgi:DNA-binding protein HU-beta
MLAPTFEGTLSVQRWPNVSGMLGVRDRIIASHQMKHYSLEDIPLQSALEELKPQMLAEGATNEAVRLVSEFIEFTTEELRIMAEKLKTKAAPKKAAAKAPAKKAETKTPAKKAGDTTKAREAAEGKRAELYAKKIKVLNKDHGAREGSNRANMLNIVLKAKTVGEAIEGGATMVDVRFAESKGFISLS